MYRVLILDEMQDIGQNLTMDLDSSEYYVTSVPDTPEAVDSLGRAMPDIVILNEQSKSADSWKVCRELNGKLGIPVIIMGRDVSENAWIKTVREGGDLYIRKPFGRRELAARVKAILRRYEIRASTAHKQ
jgi:DNA-binding response OmpR family regulator